MTDTDSQLNAVVLERTLDAPVDLVWRMWTEPDHFSAWYGPDGVDVRVLIMDVWAGGTRLVSMERATPDGSMRMWFTGEYVTVAEPVRLVYTDAMSDEHGNVLSPTEAGVPEGHPATTEVTVELEDLGGRTRMVLTHAGIPADSPGAAGWRMALDKLAAHVGAEPGS